MRIHLAILYCMAACAGERGSDTFSLHPEHVPTIDTPIAVGATQRLWIYTDAHYSPGVVNQLVASRENYPRDERHPVEDVVVRVDPADMFTTNVAGGFVELTPRRPGTATLVVEGTVRGSRTRV